MGLPHAPSAIRKLLLADAGFSTACGGRCTIRRAPTDVTSPFAVVQFPGGIPLDPHGWALKPLVQVNGWCPVTWTTDPDQATWDIVAAAMRVLGSAHYVTYTDSRGSMTYKARITDGPVPADDTSRGTASPLLGYLVRAELTLQHT